MFDGLFNWLFNRALRVPDKTVKRIAKALDQKPDNIKRLNDIIAGVAATHAVTIVSDQAAKLVPETLDAAAQGKSNAGQ